MGEIVRGETDGTNVERQHVVITVRFGRVLEKTRQKLNEIVNTQQWNDDFIDTNTRITGRILLT